MKKYYWVIGLIVLTFLGDRLGGEILRRIVLKSQFRYSRMYNNVAQSDILLVGNSRGLSFYQPTIEAYTNKKTFNISYSAMPMNLAEVLVKDYLDSYEAPEYMLVDVTICDRVNPQLVAGFNTYAPFSKRLDSLMLANNSDVFYGGKVSHLFRNNGEIFQRATYYLNKIDETWLLDRDISNRLKEDIVTVDTASVGLIDEMVASLVRTVEYAKDKNVDVRLVISPYYLPFANKISNLDEVVSKVEKATKLKVYNYAKSLADAQYFGDYQHININGSKPYIDLMKKDGVLP